MLDNTHPESASIQEGLYLASASGSNGSAVSVRSKQFTDLDLSTYPVPPGSILPLFAQLGLVDVDFHPKPALAEWDRALARPLLP